MQYVYLGLAALVAIIFVYNKLTKNKKTDEYLGATKPEEKQKK